MRKLELELKSQFGVRVEEALSDAREFLTADYETLLRSEPGLDEESCYEHFETSFGVPGQVAASYSQAERPNIRDGIAPGWRICCTRCGLSAPAAAAGITRIGAVSWHKYIMGRCSHCGRFRWLRLLKDLQQTNLTDKLAMSSTPEQMRIQMHHPWVTVASVLILVAAILTASWLAATQITAADPIATSAGPRLFDALPAGWRLVKMTTVPKGQLATFSNRLEVPILQLNNAFISRQGQTLQINALDCATNLDAERLRATLAKSKSNTRMIIRNQNRVFELVVRDAVQARLANEARYALGLQSELSQYEVQFTAAPSDSSDAARANELFNLFLRLERDDVTAEKAIDRIKPGFRFSNKLMLRDFGQGDSTTAWQFEPNAISQSSQPGGTSEYRFGELPKRFDIPLVTCKATITSKTFSHTPTNQSSKGNGNPEPTRWLAATSRWPAKDSRIEKIASEIVAQAKSEDDKLEALLAWTSSEKNIRYGGDVTGSRYGTLAALEQGYGRCWDFADLFVSLARAAGLPCRQVLGWLDGNEGHVWVEVLQSKGWYAVDPTTGLACGSDYIPFTATDDGEVSWSYASSVKIKRIE